MRLSVTTWSFPACTLAEAWAIARALGFPHVDIGPLHGPAIDAALVRRDPAAAAGALAPLGLRVANLYWLFGATLAENAMSDPAALGRNVAEFANVLVFAQAVGATSVFLLPGVLGPGTTRAEAIGHSAAAFRELVPMAAAAGITLTVEPHVAGLLTSPADTLRLLELAPGLRLALDYAHFACMGWPQAAIDPLAPHAGHVHLRQARPGALQAKWGEGTLDFPAMFDTLRAAGYGGFCAVEYVHQDYMGTLFDDVLTETVRMRDCARAHGIA
ncbi:MAG: sugar phosphate isomerase/epimerase [Rhodobacteraceae bacterium]|nr:sugar phosphate isomerase/epimerase [Paracoccaceae bacterium]